MKALLGNTKAHLLLLFICITVVLALRITVESTGYQSPDSEFYLRVVDNLLEGKGLVSPTVYPFDETTKESYFAIWPVGYPVLVTTVSYLTTLDSFIASKVVNIIFLGLTFVLLYKWFGVNSLLPAMYFCSFGKLEIYSYSWSESSFLFFLLWFLYLLEQLILEKKTLKKVVLLVFCLIAMSLLRYMGLAYFFYLAVLFVVFYVQKKVVLAKHVFWVLAVATVFVFSYLLFNYAETGGFFGGIVRICSGDETIGFVVKKFVQGILNEFSLARNFYWQWDVLYVVLFVVQLFVVVLVWVNRSQLSKSNTNSFVLVSASLFYLFFAVVLRVYSPIDTFDYRILAPFSTPLFIALLGGFDYSKVKCKGVKLQFLVIGFFILSLLINLPKVFLLNYFGA